MTYAKNISRRAESIRKAFSLRTTATGYEALWKRPDGSIFAAITGSSRAVVIRNARCNWGHFNFEDEAEAFAEIFPAAGMAS